MEFNLIIDRIYPLPPASAGRLASIFQIKTCGKGEILFRAGEIVPYVFFIKKGIVRAYSLLADDELTFWFGLEGDTIVSMKSYAEQSPGYEYIELLEDCQFYRAHFTDLYHLYDTDIYIANWGRRLAEKELLRTEERLIQRQLRGASERYRELITQQPELIRRVKLSYIASYLGITQVSLSRIRSGICD